MTSFNLHVSAFSICWLRCYDFGLEQGHGKRAAAGLKNHPLVLSLAHLNRPDEVDEIDRNMFDVRYQERSSLLRVRLQPCMLDDQELGETGRRLTAPILVNLLLDTESGFGVLNLCLCQPDAEDQPFSVGQIGLLTRQWLLSRDESDQPQRLRVQLPPSQPDSSPRQVRRLFIREVMNDYYLRIHKAMSEAARKDWPDPSDWDEAIREVDPEGCAHLCTLAESGLVRSRFPISFGPVLDIWKVKDGDPPAFDANTFCQRHESEIAWLFTDGTRTNLGESTRGLRNEERSRSRGFYLWMNHAIYINRSREVFSRQGGRARIDRYGCLDVEIVRILEILSLRSGITRVYDSILDQRLEEVSTLTDVDRQDVSRITKQRRIISRSLRTFDFYNLLHTGRWERLFMRLLENPRLNIRAAEELIERKSQYLDDEIQQAVMIQERARHQQQREQQLDVLRGLHGLSLANDVQSHALMVINFVVSATATFAFIEVLSPLLTRLFGAVPSFRQAYPLGWLGLNVGVFLVIVIALAMWSRFLMRGKQHVIELEGQLDLAYDRSKLGSRLAQRRQIEYLHWSTTENGGFLRIQLRRGVLVLEFDEQCFYRFTLFLQGVRRIRDLDQLKRTYLDAEIDALRNAGIITG